MLCKVHVPTHCWSITGPMLESPSKEILENSNDDAALDIENALTKLLESKDMLTPDLGGNSSTQQVGSAVVTALGK